MVGTLGLQIALILFGLVVAFVGLWLWKFTITVLSFSIAAGLGYLYAVQAYGDPSNLFVAVIFSIGAGIIGVMLMWGLFYFVIAVPGFVIGAVLSATFVAPHIQGGQLVVIFIGGSIGASIALALHELGIIFTSSLIGAISVSLGLKTGSLVAYLKQLLGAQAPQQGVIHLPFLTDAGFLLVFFAGVATQIGLNYFDDRFPFKQVKSRVGLVFETVDDTSDTANVDAVDAMVVCQDCGSIFGSPREHAIELCPECDSEKIESARYACHNCNTTFDSPLRKLSGIYCPSCESDNIEDSRNTSEGA